ncbi:MAG TPA: hypothetical protein VG295_03350 [Solirubrobacteraceae bacterium]|nr:hypothetical protein [Solirubrobacteraceae bacterium]
MAVFMRVFPGGRQYLLPPEEDPAEVIKSLAEVLGNRGCVVLGYDVPDQPRSNATVLLNGNVVESVEIVDVPEVRGRS